MKFAYFSNQEVNMKCYRCGGVMVYEKFFGISEEFFGWRCIFCGEIVDNVIIENRLEQRRR
jgi:ribosomal protein S27E